MIKNLLKLLLFGSILMLYGFQNSENKKTDTIESQEDLLRAHVIMADAQGRPLDAVSTYKKLNKEQYDEYIKTIFEKADEFYDDTNGKFLIFIHGGLNSPQDTIDRVKSLRQKILDSGYYPVFISWRSSLWSSYFEHLFVTRQGRRVSKALGFITSPVYLLADVGRALTRAPVVWLQGVSNGIDSFKGTRLFPEDENTEIKWKLLCDRYEKGDPNTFKIFKGKDDGPNFEGRGAAVGTLYSTTWFLTLPTKLLTAPFIDTLGKPAWQIMKRRTELLRRKPCEFESEEGCKEQDRESVASSDSPNHDKDLILDSPKTGAVGTFIERLVDFKKDYQKGTLEITIIGHSMGAIIANWIIADYGRDLQPNNLVYMAAACSIRDFEFQVVPYLKIKESRLNFYNLTLHPRAETREKWAKWYTLWIDWVPRGSLLVWIDNYLSDPESFIDRTMGRYDNIIAATHIFPKETRSRVYLKTFGTSLWGNSNPNNPQRHGDFAYYKQPSSSKFWMKDSFWDAPSNVETEHCTAKSAEH